MFSLLVSFRRGWLTMMNEFVIYVKEDVESMHDGTLACRRPGEIKGCVIGNTVENPTGLPVCFGISTIPPWTNNPVEGVWINCRADRTEDLQLYSDVSARLTNPSMICNISTPFNSTAADAV
ncbi:unnamed protein product [Somion occarium]|uniref:Uncharacterized protein n=1 Tax=Somion occarium TaxID=3059160 RepID=A0ABP1DCX3_9APHY